jgi:hypothetical protein
MYDSPTDTALDIICSAHSAGRTIIRLLRSVLSIIVFYRGLLGLGIISLFAGRKYSCRNGKQHKVWELHNEKDCGRSLWEK